jgi:hypothetical protein
MSQLTLTRKERNIEFPFIVTLCYYIGGSRCVADWTKLFPMQKKILE